jgi:CRP-like cAMP-binding protein
LIKGIIFLLNLPGSKAIRALFVRPLTVMQNERLYRKGEFIFHQGDTGRHFYLIKKGKVGIFKEFDNGRMQKIAELGTGEIFGEMAVVSDAPRSASAQCLEDTIVAVAHKDHLEALVQSNPQFTMELLNHLIKMVHKREEQLEEYRKLQEIYMKTLEQLNSTKKS